MRLGGRTWKLGSIAILIACTTIAIGICFTSKPPLEPDRCAEMTFLPNETVRELRPMWQNAIAEHMRKPNTNGTLLIQIPHNYTVVVPAGLGEYEGSRTPWARVDSGLPITITLMRDAEFEGDFIWEPQANRVDTLAIRSPD